MSLQGSQMEADDPITSYMLQVNSNNMLGLSVIYKHKQVSSLAYSYLTLSQAWARLCKCLGQDFLPYMSVVMPPLLQSAQLKPDVTITSADSEDEAEDSDDERFLFFLTLHLIVMISLYLAFI